ncbi:MAG: hypothetical protein U9N42_10630 [Campylobacterota bacterium]|nr:hypothetical protein [Campylobacterota bacterium]
MHKLLLLITISFSIFFNGCSSHSSAGKFTHSILQTKGASDMKKLQYNLDNLLEEYRVMLNRKNKHSYSKRIAPQIRFNILHVQNNIHLSLVNSKKETKKEYLKYFQVAFNKKHIENRNDYLILALHKLFYYAYDKSRTHALTALQYDVEKLKEAYKAIQVLQWSMRNLRDNNGDFLFITWQNSWQIELEKRLKKGQTFSTDMLLNLKSIKSGEESLLQPSDMRFEERLSNMKYIIQESIVVLGGEPVSLGTNAIKSIISLVLI